jgi:hypothetical protein
MRNGITDLTSRSLKKDPKYSQQRFLSVKIKPVVLSASFGDKKSYELIRQKENTVSTYLAYY